MKKQPILILFLFVMALVARSQTVVRLWEDTPPTNNNLEKPEKTVDGIVSDVSDPEMIVYLPEAKIKNNKAIIICPGGGYTCLAIDHEGHQFAKWLNTQGITAIVLKYRMPNGHKEIPLEDLREAMRYTRSKAVEWGIVDENMETKVGVAGFSAGGHLAAIASTHYTSNEFRPDFTILFYPVITMGSNTHDGSRQNLLGQKPSANDILFYSTETRVDEQTPPAILLLSDDDKLVSPQNSILYYNSLKENGVASAMYVFPEGDHGWGMRTDFKYHQEMLALLKMWLQQF